MVTHDPVAAAYTDRVIFLADGRIVDELRRPDREQVLNKMQELVSAANPLRRPRTADVWRVTWRNLFARKVRLLLSAFAIVLGVAFVAGTLIFTNAMGGAFDDIIEGSTADVEIAFKGANDFDSGQDNRTFPASVVAELEALPEVESANPQNILQTVFVIGKDGKVIGGNGPPGLAINPTNADSLTGEADPHAWSTGTTRAGPNQIALDVDAAEKGDFEIGDEVELATPGEPPVMKAKLTGLVEFGSGGLNGATLTVFDSQVHAGAVLRRPGRVQHGLAQRGRRRLPDRARERGEEGAAGRASWRAPATSYVEENKASLDEVLGFLQTFLLVFAGGLSRRRRLHHHQHLLDPGRPAQPRARAAARHGRLAPAGQRVGAPRGDGRGAARFDGRPGRRLPARARAALALRRVRAGPEPGRLPDDLAAVVLVVRRRRGASRRSLRCCPHAAPRGSLRWRPCATTWPCPSRRCGDGS